MFSVMWSEHCSYKSSRPLLRTLPTAGEGVVAGPGENAGVISIGDGLAVAFKIESHNHPSAVEPYQGAATGVGGILRDIFAMGARPIAVLDALRFGDPADAAHAAPGRRRRARRRRLRQLRRRADRRRRARLRPELRRQPAGQRHGHRPARGAAPDAGRRRPGPATWSCCSARRPAATASAGRPCWPARPSATTTRPKRPSVQVGDPFAEKLLIEATLELIERGLVEGLQDLGAGGHDVRHVGDRGPRRHRDRRRPRRGAAARGGHGAVRGHDQRVAGADVRRRPARSAGDAVREVCERWGLPAAVIGRVTDDGDITVVDGLSDGRRARRRESRPGAALTSDAIVYQRVGRAAAAPPRRARARRAAAAERPPAGARHGPGRRPAGAARVGRTWPRARGSSTQYDSTVGADTVAGRGHGAAVLRVKGTTQGARRRDRRQRGRRRARSVAGRGAGVAEATRNVVDHRRPAAGRHQLPQLRRPDAARGVLAAHRRGARPGRRLPGARPAGHRRQRLPVQRVAGRGASRRRPRSASSGCSTTSTTLVGPAFARDGDAVLLVGEAAPGPGRLRLRRAGRCRAGGRPAGARPRARGGAPGASSARRSRAGSSRPRRTCSGGGLAVALAECAMWGGLGAERAAADRATRRPSTCSARARRGSSLTLPAALRRGARAARPPARPAGRGARHGRRRPARASSWSAPARPARPRSAAPASPTRSRSRSPTCATPGTTASPAPSAGRADAMCGVFGVSCPAASRPRPRRSPRSACSRSSTAARNRPAWRSATASS